MELPAFASPRPLALALAVAAILASGCRPRYSSTFPLEWRGVEGLPRPSSPVAEALRKRTLQIDQFADTRSSPNRIGTVEENQTPVNTTSNVAAYCTQRFGQLLTSAGARIVTSGATITLRPELVVYQVIEGGLFNADVRIRVTALENGKVVYEGTHSGKSKRWGHSRNPENYNEALSNALFEATQQLLEDDQLASALGTASTGTVSNAN
jgi:hypothetical protein